MISPEGLFEATARDAKLTSVKVTHSHEHAKQIMSWIYQRAGSGLVRTAPPTGLIVDTPSGSQIARAGDYIIHVDGEFQVVRSDLFHSLFEVKSE